MGEDSVQVTITPVALVETGGDGGEVGFGEESLQCCMVPYFGDEAEVEKLQLLRDLLVDSVERDVVLQFAPSLGIQCCSDSPFGILRVLLRSSMAILATAMPH